MQPRISVKVAFVACVLCLASFGASAQDSLENRQLAADRYLKVVPMSKMLDDSFAELSKQLPEEKRADFIAQMKAVVRTDMIVRISREAMIKTFTADELNALADFYGSKNGTSAMQKFGIYMGQVMPAIQQELRQAVQELKAQKKTS